MWGAGIGGAVVAFALSPVGRNTWAAMSEGGQSAVLAGLGAGVGVGAMWLYLHYRKQARGLHVDSVDAKIPGFGAVKLKIDVRQRDAGWKIFVELATRISTQKLEPGTGLIREALTSLYKLFELIRGELKSMPPSGKKVGEGEADIEDFALAVLNHAIRPCLSRWHPLLKEWEDKGLPEAKWPLGDDCRSDLEETRLSVVGLTLELGKALGVHEAEKLLGAPDDDSLPKLKSTEEVVAAREQMQTPIDAARKQVGWKIYVELQTRIATQKLDDDAGFLREALASLYDMFTAVRNELKELPGPSKGADGADSIESVAMDILNQDLRPFMSEWHPRLSAWEAEHGKSKEADWPDEAECRAALANTRERVAESTKRLGNLLGC